MRNKRDDDQVDLESESLHSGPVSFRRDARGGVSRGRVSNRRKTSTTRRKVSKPGGIHQRANKRTNW